jgi:hypothetical protein
VTTLERSDARTQDSNIRALSWRRISGWWIGLQVVLGRMPWVMVLGLPAKGGAVANRSTYLLSLSWESNKCCYQEASPECKWPRSCQSTSASSPCPNLVSREDSFSSSHRILHIIFIINKFLMHGPLLQTKYFLQLLTKNWHELYVHRLIRHHPGRPGWCIRGWEMMTRAKSQNTEMEVDVL